MENKPMPLPENEPFENIIARIARVPAQRIETRELVIHHKPRISATKLAEFVIADPARQKTIIKNSKIAQKSVILQYTKTRQCFYRAFTGNGLDGNVFQSRAGEIEKEKAETTWQQGDNERNILALNHLVKIAPKIKLKDATLIDKPSSGWGSLEIAGVKVSIQPDLVFSFKHLNITKIGGILLSLSKSEQNALSRSNGDNRMADYLTCLLFQLLLKRSKHIGAPLNSRCLAIDVFREEIYHAPVNYKTLNKHMEAACEVIALRWPQIDVGDVEADVEG
jgi:hypothetical protein